MILDIIGYWITVSFISTLLLLWLIQPIHWLLNYYCKSVFLEDSPRWGDSLLRWKIRKKSNLVIIFNKYKLHADVAACLCMASFLFLIFILTIHLESPDGMLTGIHTISAAIAPFIGNLLLMGVAWCLFIKVSRFIVTVSKTLRAIEEKLKND